jgi:Berberine and berberine like
MPQSLFENCTTISDLVNAVLRGVRFSNNLLPGNASLTQVIMTTPVNIQNSNATSANTAWRTALWHRLMTGRWTEELGIVSKTALLESWLDTVKPLKDLTPGRGYYLNEGHYLQPEWQETFYGPNYAALLEIKKKYDPTRFFDYWKYVS